MRPRMRTRSVGRPAAKSLGGGMGVRIGRGGRGKRPREGNDEGTNDLNGQGNDQVLRANGGIEGVNGNVEGVNEGVGNQGNVENQNGNVVNENEYDGKGGAVVLTRWIEKIESVQDMSVCSVDQKVKYTAGSFVGKDLTWWNSQIRTLSQEVTVSMSLNDFKFMIIEEFCPSHEMQKLESELWNHAMVKAGHAAYIDRFYELARLVPHLVTLESRMIERYVYGLALQFCGIVAATEPKTIQKAVQIFGALTDEPVRNGSIKKDCRGVPRNVNLVSARNPTVRACYECGSTNHVRSACPRLNRAQGPEENRPNQVAAYNGGQGRGNQGNQARGRAFMLGVEEARQDPNIVMGIEPSELAFKYEIEIASMQLVKIDKVIKGCKLEIEGHVFDIDLIPFGHGSFDVIICMDWLSNYKAEIIFMRKYKIHYQIADKKQEEIVVVRDFPKVFPDDLSGLPPLWEIEFRIELILGALADLIVIWDITQVTERTLEVTPRILLSPQDNRALSRRSPDTSDRHLIELENQVQRLMEAYLAPTQPIQVNKITTSCEICSGPRDTQYCMYDPEKGPRNPSASRKRFCIPANADGDEFTKTLQSIPTTRKLSERESLREIIDLDHFYDT
ncbi:zinc finger, CCHC-type, retrotransposon gag domain protein [Tanacetum coccineum]